MASSASTEVVTGTLLSGMSTTVVTPPAAAAAVPVAKPSHSVRPGSSRCTCESTSPGSSTASAGSTVSAPTSNAWREETTPSSITTVAGAKASPRKTRRAAIRVLMPLTLSGSRFTNVTVINIHANTSTSAAWGGVVSAREPPADGAGVGT